MPATEKFTQFSQGPVTGGMVLPEGGSVPTQVEGRNGNVISFNPAPGQSQCSVTDTAGRTLLSFSLFGLGYPASTSTVQVAGLSNPYTATWGSTPSNFNVWSTSVGPNNGYCPVSIGGGGSTLPVATLGNSMTETRSYNKREFLTSVSVQSGSVYSLGLTYEPNGNIATANDNVNGNWTYSYEALNRLLTAGQAFSYVYDRYGNRWQ